MICHVEKTEHFADFYDTGEHSIKAAEELWHEK